MSTASVRATHKPLDSFLVDTLYRGDPDKTIPIAGLDYRRTPSVRLHAHPRPGRHALGFGRVSGRHPFVRDSPPAWHSTLRADRQGLEHAVRFGVRVRALDQPSLRRLHGFWMRHSCQIVRRLDG